MRPSGDHVFVDGPGFCEWALADVPVGKRGDVFGDAVMSGLLACSNGYCADAFGFVDQVCETLGLGIDDVPDNLWLTADEVDYEGDPPKWFPLKDLA